MLATEPIATPNQVSTGDIFKGSFLENFQNPMFSLNWDTILLSMALAFLLGLGIYVVYKVTFSGVMYSKNFGVSLVMIAMVTTMIILPISSNIVLSLGMVGALSIVRFRTAVKDPIDTVFMFWAIAVGICLGAKLVLPAILGSIVIGGILLLMSFFKFKKSMPYLLVLRYDDYARNDVQNLLRKLPQGNLKSKSINPDFTELTIEMRVKPQDIALVDKFLDIDGVIDASLISYNGELG